MVDIGKFLNKISRTGLLFSCLFDALFCSFLFLFELFLSLFPSFSKGATYQFKFFVIYSLALSASCFLLRVIYP